MYPIDMAAGGGSHLPVLIRVVSATVGPVLELGTGYWSTGMLDILCQRTRRKVVSYENNPNWYEMTRTYQSDYHDVHLITDWTAVNLEAENWAVALVDHLPNERRRFEAIRLAPNTTYVVIHDSQQRHWKLERAYAHFAYRFEYTACFPWTVVLSNTVDPGWLSGP